jgi:type I restriction-modification system DNA methylase subunit
MASLFGKNKLREIASRLNTPDIEEKISIVKTWHNDYHNGSLKQDKETSREQAYNQDFFIKILGYKEKPTVPYSFEPKATTDKGQLPDAVLSHTDVSKDLKNIAAVVELKGAAIELDRPQRRDGNMSPVQQGFKYKTQYRNCPFVVVSNFWEFRLYHDNQLDYELWTLDDLVNPDEDYLKFKTFITLLHSDNLTTPKGSSKTESWLSDIRFEQEEIGKKFYKVYREARLDLLRDIYRQNESVRDDIDMGIEKSQKIIDRIVFACFAEDRGLLPDDTIRRVIDASDTSAFGGSLWSTFKGFFEAIDIGSEKLEIPNGYNGGLFAHDPLLNALKISDGSLRGVVKLSDYNFVEDLSVNILGHIFEQSISDLEEIKSKVQESQNLDSLQQSRRKKDGIFYTPDYIVRYIVDNSVGSFLRQAEEKLKEEYKLKGDITDKTYEKREKQAYGKYQEFLHGIKVVDPACGSGAFLVYVFDYLLAENQRVASILGNSLFSSEDYIKFILKNNIYGVDLNDESVEITKLSLWLKSAQKGKKLTTLDDNIKTGNSLLIDWHRTFPDVFKQGGFDVVVMNPPYVKETAGRQIFADLHSNPLYQGKMDLWYLFGSLALDITKTDEGIIGLIAPNNWVTNDGASKFRKKLSQDAKIDKFIDFNNFKVFEQAGIQTMIMIMSHSKSRANYRISYSKVTAPKPSIEDVRDFLNGIRDTRFVHFESEFNREKQKDEIVTFNNSIDKLLLSKIVGSDRLYLDVNEIFSGIDIGQDYVNKKSQAKLGDDFSIGDGVFNLSLKEYSNLNLNNAERQIVRPFYTTKQINRYLADPVNSSWVIYTDSKFKNISEIQSYPNVKNHLDRFLPIITSANKPYGLHRSRDERIFLGEKILSIRKCAQPSFSYVDFDTYVNRTFNIIKTNRVDMRYLTALLNSRLVAFWLLKQGKLQGDQYQVDVNPLRSIPIVVSNEQESLAGLTDKMSELNLEINNTNSKFQRLVRSGFGITKTSPRLSSWWKVDFEEFVQLLNVQTTLLQRDELMQLFDKYQPELARLNELMQSTDQILNQAVYQIYGLNEAEIKHIEQSL